MTQTIGERLKAIRIYLLGISQEEMAQKLGVDEGTLRRWEKGAEIRNRIARKRAHALHLENRERNSFQNPDEKRTFSK